MIARPTSRAEHLALVLLVVSQVVLFLVPVVVLGQAIGWPASLRLPAAEALPLVARNLGAIQVGYWGYLLTAVAMLPLALALRGFAHARGAHGLVVDAMAAFGAAAAVLKTLGIVRWLIAMPGLAVLHAGSGDPVVRAAAEVGYTALNGYAGSVGELLGVQLFSGLWLVLLGIVLSRIGFRLNGTAAGVIGAGFVLTAFRSALPQLDVLGSVVPAVALAWFLAFAVTLLRTR